MDTRSIEQRIRDLNEKELEVLFFKCLGQTYQQMESYFYLGTDMIQKYASSMYNTLGFDATMHPKKRKQKLEDEYCPVLRQFGSSLDEIKANLHPTPSDPEPVVDTASPGWLIVYQELALESRVQGDTSQTNQEESTQSSATNQEATPDQWRKAHQSSSSLNVSLPKSPNQESRQRIWAIPWWFVLLTLCCMMFVGAVIGREWFGKTVVVTPTSAITARTSPAYPEVPSPAYPGASTTQTLSPTLVLTLMPTATSTLPTTPTQLPTNSASATSAPSVISTQEILFHDDFGDGLDPRWQTLQGTLFPVDNYITTNGDLVLFFAADWNDYRVSLKYGNWCDNFFCVSTIGLRAADPGNMIALTGGPGKSSVFNWNIVKNGKTTLIPNTGFSTEVGGEGVIELEAVKNKCQVVGYTTVDCGDFPAGGIYLKIRNGMKLYSIIVTDLSPAAPGP